MRTVYNRANGAHPFLRQTIPRQQDLFEFISNHSNEAAKKVVKMREGRSKKERGVVHAPLLNLWDFALEFRLKRPA
jgi:hypothetical protein